MFRIIFNYPVVLLTIQMGVCLPDIIFNFIHMEYERCVTIGWDTNWSKDQGLFHCFELRFIFRAPRVNYSSFPFQWCQRIFHRRNPLINSLEDCRNPMKHLNSVKEVGFSHNSNTEGRLDFNCSKLTLIPSHPTNSSWNSVSSIVNEHIFIEKKRRSSIGRINIIIQWS